MIYNSILILLALGLLQTAAEVQIFDFSEITTTLLHNKCLRNSAHSAEVLEAIQNLKHNCFNLHLGPEKISDEELKTLCQKEAEKYVQCTVVLAEKADSCLHDREKYIKEHIVSMANDATSAVCDNIAILNAGNLSPNTVKCAIALAEHPLSACEQNSTMINMDPIEIIDKHEFCWDLVHTSFCYTDILDKNCHDATEYMDVQRDIIQRTLEKCIRVAYRGTRVEVTTHPTITTK